LVPSIQEPALLIRGVTALTGDAALGDLREADILVRGTRIAALGAVEAAPDAEVIEAAGMIAIPGFVDSHRHTWQCLLRNTAADWTLGQYFAGVRGVMGGRFTPEDMHIANLCGALECLDAGITTLVDWSHNNNSPAHADAAIAGLREAGIRAVFAYGNANAEWIPVSDRPTDFADLQRVRRRWFTDDDGLLTLAFAARGPQYATEDITRQDFKTAHELGLRITVHAGSGLWGYRQPVRTLHRLGLLYPGTTYVHCCTLLDEELRLIADSAGHASLSPEVELNMGHGWPAALRCLSAGLRPSLSIDVTTSIGGDMFTAMRMVMAAARAEAHRPALEQRRMLDKMPISARDVLGLATQAGAAAAGLDGQTGTLTPGKQADIVLIGTGSLNMFPVNNPVGAVVEAAHVGNVDTVMVAGRIVKRHGQLVGVDLPALRRRMEHARDALFARAGVPADGTWQPVPHSGGTERVALR
jgi:cytosine/adenosine deaminase-related metal-dependent hydrolase